jgi:CheY-like chemotaxis protein
MLAEAVPFVLREATAMNSKESVGRRPRLLLIEDDDETRTLLRRILNLCGWDVIEAATVAEGLSRLEPPPDCLVLDLFLPEGEAILGRVRDDRLPTRIIVNAANAPSERLKEVTYLEPEAVIQNLLESAWLQTICGMKGASPACTLCGCPHR